MQEMGVDDADHRQYWKNYSNREYNFNFAWNGDKYDNLPYSNGYGWNTGKMINTKLPPPKDFTFFFGEGVSEVDIKNGLMYKRVMIVNQITINESSVNSRQQTNAFDFWGENKGAGIFDFLKNFELFNRDPWGGTSVLDYMNFDKSESFLNALC